jgi:hypothetical protein
MAIPGGLAAVILGTAVAWILHKCHFDNGVSSRAGDVEQPLCD